MNQTKPKKKKKGKLRWLLLPFSFIFYIIVHIRNFLYDYRILKSKRFDFPVISIGNITVGGTGKTPHIEYLVGLLQENYKVATLSRGYKRKSKGFILAENSPKARTIGDEPKQIKMKFPKVDVAVDKKRIHGVEELLKQRPKLKVILLDDAFQHRKIEPGLSILLIDFNRPITEDYMLPYGELRDNVVEMRRAKIIIITKTPEDIKPIEQRIIEKKLNPFPFQNLYFTSIAYQKIQPVFNAPHIELSKDSKRTILLITGIAKPHHLLDHLQAYTENVIHLKYSDHHYFSEKDIRHIQQQFQQIESTNKIILTTEKDAMRLHDNEDMDKKLKHHLYYIPVKIQFINNDSKQFDNDITKYIKKELGQVKPIKRTAVPE